MKNGTYFCGGSTRSRLYIGMNFLSLSCRMFRRLGANTSLPILWNSSIAFVSIPKMQVPITSVVNFAASSRQSMTRSLPTLLSRYSSKWCVHFTTRGNISRSFPDVNIDESLFLSGRHRSASKKNRCADSGSTCEFDEISLVGVLTVQLKLIPLFSLVFHL